MCTAMDTLIQKFDDGVHTDADCGTAKGYAAISSFRDYTDLHKLDEYRASSSLLPGSHKRKKSFYNQDIIVYLIARISKCMRNCSVYLIIFTENYPNYSPVESMCRLISSRDNIIATIRSSEGIYIADVWYNEIHFTDTIRSITDLNCILELNEKLVDICVLTYPSLNNDSKYIINLYNPIRWCVPASRMKVYVSSGGIGSYSHFAYPWSKSPTCAGFTIGTGNITTGRIQDINKYIGLFAFYENMISNNKLNRSCIDCIALSSMANDIRGAIDRDAKSISSKLSISNLIPTSALQWMIDDYNSDGTPKQQ